MKVFQENYHDFRARFYRASGTMSNKIQQCFRLLIVTKPLDSNDL